MLFLLSSSVFAVTEYKSAKASRSHIYFYYQCDTGEKKQVTMRMSDEKTKVNGLQGWHSMTSIELAIKACYGSQKPR